MSDNGGTTLSVKKHRPNTINRNMILVTLKKQAILERSLF
jgi:hypothetical protein